MADTFTTGNLPAVRNILLNREDRNRLEDALPREKGGLTARYTRGRFSGLARATYYGSIVYHHPTKPVDDERFSAKTLFDLDLSYELRRGVRLALGAENILNTYPDQQVHSDNISLGRFIYSRRVTQFGMNGGFYYGRLQLSLEKRILRLSPGAAVSGRIREFRRAGSTAAPAADRSAPSSGCGS